MMTPNEILEHLKSILSDNFEIAAEDVRPEAHLYQDLDLDSIDAVDLVIKLQELTGKRIKPEEFKSVRTVQDVVDAVSALSAA